MKSKHVEQLIKAHDDAAYAYHTRSQDLSPRQSNSRTTLRKQTQLVEAKLEDLDYGIRKIKRTGGDDG
jgi:hypothetical protein